MGLARTVSEINGDFSRKSQNFPTPVYFCVRWRCSPCSRVSALRVTGINKNTGRQQRPRYADCRAINVRRILLRFLSGGICDSWHDVLRAKISRSWC